MGWFNRNKQAAENAALARRLTNQLRRALTVELDQWGDLNEQERAWLEVAKDHAKRGLTELGLGAQAEVLERSLPLVRSLRGKEAA